MNVPEFEIDVVRIVQSNDGGDPITVRPDQDGLGLIEIVMDGTTLLFVPQQAVLVARALTACAADIETAQ